MIAVRRLFFCIALLGITLPTMPSLHAVKTKAQKLAQNQTKLKRSIANLKQLETRLTSREIDADKKDNYQRRWNGDLKDIDKYIGKVRRYGGSASPPAHYRSWEMMASRVNWKTAAEETAEDRKAAQKKAQRYEAKVERYEKSARKDMKRLNSGKQMSEETKNALVASYRQKHAKVVSNITKANSILKRFGMSEYAFPATTLPAQPPVRATIISAEDERKEQLSDAKKAAEKYKKKADAYTRAAKKVIRLLGNPATEYGPAKIAARKREYHNARKKAGANVAKANKFRSRFKLGADLPPPSLPPVGQVPIKVKQVSNEDYTKAQRTKHFKKLAYIIGKLGQVGKKMEQKRIDYYKKKYKSEYGKTLKTLKVKSIIEYPIPLRLRVLVTPVEDGKGGDEVGVGKWVNKLKQIKDIITTGSTPMTSTELSSYQSSYRKTYAKVKREAPDKLAGLPAPDALQINDPGRVNEEEDEGKKARITKLQAAIRQSAKRLNSKKGILQEEFDAEVANYRRDHKKLKQLSPVAAEEFAANPPVDEANVVAPTKLRTRLIRKIKDIKSAVEKGVTEENFTRLQTSFINSKKRLNDLEAKYGLPKTTLSLGSPTIKDEAAIVAEYKKEIDVLDEKIKKANKLEIATGSRHRNIKRREQLALLMKKAGHTPPPMPSLDRQERKAAQYRTQAAKKRKEAAALKEEGRDNEAKAKLRQANELEQDAEHAESNIVNRLFHDKKSERELTRSEHRKKAASAKQEAETLSKRAKDLHDEANDAARSGDADKAKALRKAAQATEEQSETAKVKAKKEKHESQNYLSRKWDERQERKEAERKQEAEWRAKNGGGASSAPGIAGGGMAGGMAGGGMGMAAGQTLAPQPMAAVPPQTPSEAPPTPEEIERQRQLDAIAQQADNDSDELDESEDDDEDEDSGGWGEGENSEDDDEADEEATQATAQNDPALAAILAKMNQDQQELAISEDNDDDNYYDDDSTPAPTPTKSASYAADKYEDDAIFIPTKPGINGSRVKPGMTDRAYQDEDVYGDTNYAAAAA